VGVVWVALYVAVERLKAFPLTQDDTATILAALFVLTYAVSAVYNLFKEFDIKFGWQRKSKAKEESGSGGAGDMLRRMRENQVAADAANAEAGEPAVMAETDIEELREQIAQEDAEEVADRTGADDFATAVHDDAPAAVEAEPEGPPPEAPPPPEPPKAAEKSPEPPKAEKKAPEKPPEPPKPEKPQVASGEAEARQGLLAFAREALAAATRDQSQMNAFSRFGLNLYVAGACSMIGQAKKLSRAAQLVMLRDSLQAAGNSPERSENFCAELPSHGKNPRYAAMIQSGGTAMSRQLAGQPAGTQELTNMLAEWTKPEKRPTVPSAFTFMFTDIVNSTALTSQLGNAGAQRVVRAHNAAVRGAIQAYQGREVKHTGDGIMATFPSPLAAVQASIRAQKEIVAHSAANPSVAFAIRIGVNVGEAVEEDNDFFGAAVQMTARICSVATPANSWVSRAVVDACKGQRLGFIPRGAFQMKGIQQARPLYEIAYTDAHKNEIANL
jgi:adenylate cyclase